MDNKTNKPAATAETFWAAVQALTELQAENAREMAENNRIITEMQAKNAREMAENNRIITEMQAKTDRQMEETDRKMAETARQMAETDRQITRLEKEIGGVSRNHGSFAEEYFANSLEQGEIIFLGEKFDKLIKAAVIVEEGNRIKAEVDILLVNGKSVAIIEVKFKVRDKHVDRMFKKAKIFRERFSEYGNHQVYLGFASLIFDDEIKDRCLENGIAVIKQVGDTVVIYDENLKTF
jgi:hypothetical protein